MNHAPDIIEEARKQVNIKEDKGMTRYVTAKLGNMRKPQEFIVYPTSDQGNVIVQSDKSIGSFDAKTGEGMLNIKGCYFVHLNRQLGARPYTFPTEFVVKCIAKQFEAGDLIGTSPITGPVYMGTVTEI